MVTGTTFQGETGFWSLIYAGVLSKISNDHFYHFYMDGPSYPWGGGGASSPPHLQGWPPTNE